MSGEKKVSDQGYVLVWQPDHPRNHMGWVFEHILVMEASLGRYLTEKERVHHEDRDRTNNTLGNLKLLATQSDHRKLHIAEDEQHWSRTHPELSGCKQPIKLAKSMADADVVGQAFATMNVLLDQDAVLNGDAAAGKPYMYYDLGSGWCLYQFFGTCPYRMACPGCDFFIPKKSTRGLLLERKQNVLRLQQELPLTPEEAEAVEHDQLITDKLLAKLRDQPTPSGQRPSELAQRFTAKHPLPVAPRPPKEATGSPAGPWCA
jgi:hypothetical protein